MSDDTPTPAAEPTGRPGRYDRTFGGLVGSMIVVVIGIGLLLAFMGAFRDDLEVRPEKVDHLETVAGAQQSGLTPVYPTSLPDGWIATGVDIVAGNDPAFMIRMLTDEDRFVALRQEDTSTGALLESWVDEDTEPTEPYESPANPVAVEWEGWTDEDGDTAYAAELDDETVMVFGSAPAEDLQTLIDLLSVEPLR